MNTIATQERIPKQVVLPATDVVGLVQNTKVLRALNAGWATLEDLKFLTPLFALAQDAVYLGAEASVDEIGGQRKAHLAVDEAYRRSMQYGQALEILSVSRMPEGAAPSFLQHYRSRCAEMTLEQSPDRSANDVAWLVADLMLASVQHALQKAGLIADGMVEPTRTVATLVDGAENNALAVHLELLTNLYTAMRYQRVLPSLDRIQARVSLEIEAEPPIALFPGVGEIMCRERDDARDIEFTVERYPCTAEVLDPRVVRIPPGKSNNRHKHAHETLFYFVSGTGEILVGEKWVQVKPGDAVFSPRWSIHQTRNTGQEDLTLLAITDYYLTSRVYVGKYDKI